MKMTLNNVSILNRTIRNIINNENYKIDVVTKFQMLGILKGFESSLENIDTIRNEKIVEYGTTDENGYTSIDAKDTENMAKFLNDMNELMETTVDVNVTPLDAKTVMDMGLTDAELMALYDIMELK